MHADPFGADDRALPIRSGNHTIALGGNGGGIVAWERTIAEILVRGGYANAIYGNGTSARKTGRFPTDHGFDEWYGPLRTYDECMWLGGSALRPGTRRIFAHARGIKR